MIKYKIPPEYCFIVSIESQYQGYRNRPCISVYNNPKELRHALCKYIKQHSDFRNTKNKKEINQLVRDIIDNRGYRINEYHQIRISLVSLNSKELNDAFYSNWNL